MRRKIIKRAKAKRDVIELADYIASDNIEAAGRFILAAGDAFRLLAERPDSGALREHYNPSFTGLRMWPIRGFEKHIIFYREIPKGLEIIRVLHSARDIEAVFKTEESGEV